MKEETKLFKALANERRLRILNQLTKFNPLTVGAIAEHIKLSFKSTSRHMQILYAVGLVKREQVNLEMYYQPNKEHEFWPQSISRIILKK